MATVYIGIGSNVGGRADNIRVALCSLARNVRVAAASPLYETSPVGGPPQRPYLNAAARIETPLPLPELLALLKSIERSMGRAASTERNVPRAIDLDILLAGRRVIRGRTLAVPHPRLAQRRFVLVPLSRIAPGARHPLLHKTVRSLAARAAAAHPEQKVRQYRKKD